MKRAIVSISFELFADLLQLPGDVHITGVYQDFDRQGGSFDVKLAGTHADLPEVDEGALIPHVTLTLAKAQIIL